MHTMLTNDGDCKITGALHLFRVSRDEETSEITRAAIKLVSFRSQNVQRWNTFMQTELLN